METYVIQNEIDGYSEEIALNYLEAAFGLKVNGFYETAFLISEAKMLSTHPEILKMFVQE